MVGKKLWDNLELLPWTPMTVALWVRHKTGVTVEAVEAAGGCMARYYGQYYVVAFPIYGPALTRADPVGWVLYNTNGGDLPVFHGKGESPSRVKVKTTKGSKAGLLGRWGIERLNQAEVITKVEGPTDMLSLWAAIPAELRETQLVICNSGGAAEKPRPEYVQLISAPRVIVVGDADRPGLEGAVAWAQSLAANYGDVRHVKLPFEAQDSHGKDLRDYLTDGHLYQDLLSLADSSEPVPATGADAAGEDYRPVIVLTTDEHLMNDEAVEALSKDETLYQRGGILVRVCNEETVDGSVIRSQVAPRIVQVQLPTLRELLSANARFVKLVETDEGEKELPIHPPDFVVKAVAARGEWPGMRSLVGVVEHPILRPDGTVLQKRGYDCTTGILYLPSATFPTVADRPTAREVQEAVDQLMNLIADFPFRSDVDRAAWLAFLLTPFARHHFTGPSPLFLIDANVRQAESCYAISYPSLSRVGTLLEWQQRPTTTNSVRGLRQPH